MLSLPFPLPPAFQEEGSHGTGVPAGNEVRVNEKMTVGGTGDDDDDDDVDVVCREKEWMTLHRCLFL